MVVAAVLPLPAGAFTGHMARHLLVGMVAPLLLVLGRPVTLALRVLAGRPRRALLTMVHARAVGWLVCPPMAAVLDVGGLWVLYRTPLFALVHNRPWAHALVHLHVLVAGVLFTQAVGGLEPSRRRWSMPVRAGTLVVASAAHAVLARLLYAAPPPGAHVSPADAASGALLMYYGGDVVAVGLAVVVALDWYAAAGRAQAAQRRRRGSAGGPAPGNPPTLAGTPDRLA